MLRHARPRLTYANVAATLALVLAMAGGSYAAINSVPGSGAVIHGCYQKRGGSLRLVDAGRKCSSSENPIAFNQQGRPGARGSTGKRGPTGPSGAYQVSTNTAADPLTLTLAVPAGSYAVVAKAVAASGTSPSAPGGAECVLSATGGMDEDASVNSILPDSVATFANTIATTSIAPTTIEYACSGSGGTPPSRGFYQARIVATRVGATH